MEQQAPLVSVVIPTFNSEGFLRSTLDSISRQDHPALELVIVDDASEDGTREVLEEWQRGSSLPVELVFLEQNQGASHARNIGWKRARGAYIQFLDSDDRLEADKISGQVGKMEKEGGDVVIGDYKKIEPSGEELSIRCGDFRDRPWVGLMRTRLGNTCSNLWRKNILEKIGGWNEEMASSQESELLLRALKEGATLSFDDRSRTIVYKRASGSISSSNVQKKWKRYVQLRIEILDHLESRTKDPEALRPYYRTLLEQLTNWSRSDPEYAIGLYKERIPRDKSLFRGVRCGVIDRILFRLFGFEKAVRIKHWLWGVRKKMSKG